MEEFITGFAIGVVVFTLIVSYIGATRGQVMAEAFERGYAVECPNKEGYYWECE